MRGKGSARRTAGWLWLRPRHRGREPRAAGIRAVRTRFLSAGAMLREPSPRTELVTRPRGPKEWPPPLLRPATRRLSAHPVTLVPAPPDCPGDAARGRLAASPAAFQPCPALKGQTQNFSFSFFLFSLLSFSVCIRLGFIFPEGKPPQKEAHGVLSGPQHAGNRPDGATRKEAWAATPRAARKRWDYGS